MPVLIAINTTPIVSVVREWWRSNCSLASCPSTGIERSEKQTAANDDKRLQHDRQHQHQTRSAARSRPTRREASADNREILATITADAGDDQARAGPTTNHSEDPSSSSARTSRIASSGDKWLALRRPAMPPRRAKCRVRSRHRPETANTTTRSAEASPDTALPSPTSR